MIRIRLALLFWLAAIGGVHAHVTGTGLAGIEARDGRMVYALQLALNDVAVDLANALAAAAEGDARVLGRLDAVAREAIVLRAGSERCTHERVTASRLDAKFRLELWLDCPSNGGTLALTEDWRPLFGEHYRSIVSVRTSGGTREYILGEGAREAQLDLAAPSRWHGFVLLGIEHILTGFDHLLFLLALLVNQRRIGPVVRIVTAFTVAHSITLSLAALRVVDLPGGLVEPLIAASIVWVALENLFLAGAEWRRLLVAFAFGLVHGLGFAGALGELALSGTALAKALIGFNLGVELGQIACVLVFLPLFVWASRPAALARLPQMASVLVALMGGFWFVERVFFS
jgi:hypothetical protein